MVILSMVLSMVYLMVKDSLLKADLMHSSFGASSGCSHNGLIGPFDPLVDGADMVDVWYLNIENVDYGRMVVYYVFQNFLSYLAL